MTGRPRILQQRPKSETRHYVNRNALYDIVTQRKEFIRNIRAYGKPVSVLDVRGQGERCGFNPPCRHNAVELRIWHTHKEFLCQIEIDELQKRSEK
jgi:hypothetical protein